MHNKPILLELLNISNVKKLEKRKDDILDYYFEHYSYFQKERAKIIDDIKEVLLDQCIPFPFSHWHRCISYEHSDNPLSSRGSLLNDPGGRFNIGDIASIKFPKFPALYLADTFETAYRERNQSPALSKKDGLSADELALSHDNSFTNVIVKGQINLAIDLTKPRVLHQFFKCIRDITLPKHLKIKAHKLKIPPLPEVASEAMLKKSILDQEWRVLPMQADVPANSQIFGQLLNEANVEAVIYPSRMKHKSLCIAVFVNNFAASSSTVCISGSIPPTTKHRCLDNSTWRDLT